MEKMQVSRPTTLCCIFAAGTFIIILINYFVHVGTQRDYVQIFWNGNDSQLLSKVPLTIDCNKGRLGNQMFTYAALYGLASMNRRIGQVQMCNYAKLRNAFHLSLPSIPDLQEHLRKPYKIKNFLRLPRDASIPIDANILTNDGTTPLFPESFSFFDRVRDKIRQEFKFRERIEAEAQSILSRIAGNGEIQTFVGVHVRRGDYFYHLDIYKQNKAGVEFFQRAFQYFRNKFAHCVFVVVSDDTKWCLEHLNWKGIRVQNMSSDPALDLALMSQCNHTVFDYGTYGFWGAFLAGGETVYFGNRSVPGAKYYIDDYSFYLDEWVAL